MKVAVAMSGGVDSSLVAALLLKEGHEVIGLTMRMSDPGDGRKYCATEDSITDAQRVADHLGIPLTVVDVSAEFENYVIGYIRDDYLGGRTPNPCVVCNRQVKFGVFIERALESGLDFDYLATGHYVRLEQDEVSGRHCLRKAVFLPKDQSYFLSLLTQEQLGRVLFPLGNFESKDVTRKMAEEMGIPVFAKKDSQDFLSGSYTDVIDVENRPGDIVTEDGEILGKHRGIWHYTVGQRRGLGVSYKYPLYVTKIDSENNRIVTGPVDSLFSGSFYVRDVNWVKIDGLKGPLEVNTRIRYLHKEAPSTVEDAGEGRVKVTFAEPQKAVTPGQIAVFYDGELVVGGGIIE